jgi:uncharacterized damage-inducible protein DinB
MTTSELIKFECDAVGFQVEKVFEGLSDADYSVKTIPVAMSAAETLVHLCECYVAFAKHIAGEKHEWGTFVIADPSPSNLRDAWKSHRAEAVTLATTSNDHAKLVHEFIIAHDAYHVGQMALLRLSLDESWDAYSIYGFEG